MTAKRKQSLELIATVLLVNIVSLTLGALRAVDSGPAREITVVARGMAFYLEGNPIPNPLLEFEPAERIAITFINQERGIQHDLRFPALNLGTGLLDGGGSSERLIFRVPAERGDSRYTCSIHAIMMNGRVSIR